MCDIINTIKNDPETTFIFMLPPLGKDRAIDPPSVIKNEIPAPMVIRTRYTSPELAIKNPKAMSPAINTLMTVRKILIFI